jgi:hypothetical protein
MIGMFDTIFKANESTIDGSCESFDIIGISKAI